MARRPCPRPSFAGNLLCGKSQTALSAFEHSRRFLGAVRTSPPAATTKLPSRALSGMQANSDESLIARIAQGDRLAMKVLYGRHHVRVYRFALRLTRDESVAEDLIGEVFLDVWRQAGKFEGRSAVTTW